MPISIALCADDYAQHAGVDDAVCSLLVQGRLSAVSCMSEAPRWRTQAAPRLREQLDSQRRAEFGLHLNLTEHFGPPQASLAALIVRSYARRLDCKALRIQFERQFDAFEEAMGQAPDFVDGHQHVHQLPQVRAVLLDLLARRYAANKPWVRNTVPVAGLSGAKPRILELLGGQAMARQLGRLDIRSNRGFAGVYGFDTPDYAARFESWLWQARQGTLLMCHPGSLPDAHDPISMQRLVEYSFLSSARFAVMLGERGVNIAPLSRILAGQELPMGADNKP